MVVDLINRGLELYASGDFVAAVEAWRAVQRGDPHDALAGAYLGYAQQVLTSLEEAAENDGPWGVCGPMDICSTGPALALVEATLNDGEVEHAGVAPEELQAMEAEMRERVELDDFSVAFRLASRILALHPTHVVAEQTRDRARRKLLSLYESCFGGARAVPDLVMAPDELIWQDLDHRAGFILSQVDGVSNFDEIADVAGLDRLESYEILAKLVRIGAIKVA